MYMVIPSYLLRQRATMEPYLGETAYGPKYGAPVEVPVRLTTGRRVVVNARGEDVVTEAIAYFRPEVQVPELSRVACDGRQYVVVSATLHQGPTRPAYLEVGLRGTA